MKTVYKIERLAEKPRPDCQASHCDDPAVRRVTVTSDNLGWRERVFCLFHTRRWKEAVDDLNAKEG